MTAASRSAPCWKLLGRDHSARRTRFSWGETVVLGEGMDKSSRGARRGMGPGAYARVAEIMSGRAISQQGLAATCKDLPYEGEPEAAGGIWSGAWARRSNEGGVTPSEMTLEVIPMGGNTPRGQRGPGHSAAWGRAGRGDMAGRVCQHNLPRRTCAAVALLSPRRGDGQTTRARGVCEPALELPLGWEGPCSDKWVQSRGQNRTREIRPSGIAWGLWET